MGEKSEKNRQAKRTNRESELGKRRCPFSLVGPSSGVEFICKCISGSVFMQAFAHN